MKRFLILLSLVLIWTCSSSSSKPTEPTVPTQPPTVNNLTLTTNEDTPTTFTMTGTDPGNFALTFSIATQPQHGTLSTSGSSGTYTPKANYNGEDTFGFIATNGTLTSTAGIATITIAPVDDDPNTMNVSAVTDEDNAVEIILEAEEYDGDTISFNIKDNPANGAVTLSGDKATYTPNENYFGSDSFTFEAVDTTAKTILNTATASITINPINDAPAVEDMQEVEGVEDTELTITLTGTDIDGDNLSFEVDTAPTQGTITENGTTFTYTPNQDFYGADSLTYKAYDGTEYSEAKKIPLFIDRGPRDWPFIYHRDSILSLLGTSPYSYEGKMFDFNNNGLGNLVGFSNGELNVLEYIPNHSLQNNYPLVFSYDIFSQISSNIIGSDPSYYETGIVKIYDLNNDNTYDVLANFVQDTNGNVDAGPLVLGLSNSSGDYDWSVIEENVSETQHQYNSNIFWNDNSIQFTDFDFDGDIDIVGHNDGAYSGYQWGDNKLIFFKNNGDFTFEKNEISLDSSVSFEELEVLDINNDGIRDLVGIGKMGVFHFLFGTSSFNQFNYLDIEIGEENDHFTDLTFIDIDLDGDSDIVGIRQIANQNYAEFEIYVLKNNQGFFVRDYSQTDLVINFQWFNGGQDNRILAWDFDNDGDEDLFIDNYWLYMNQNSGINCCFCWEREEQIENTGQINHGFFWKNNDGIFEKTYYSTKQDECNFDGF